jgi:hypothetical protein
VVVIVTGAVVVISTVGVRAGEAGGVVVAGNDVAVTTTVMICGGWVGAGVSVGAVPHPTAINASTVPSASGIILCFMVSSR